MKLLHFFSLLIIVPVSLCASAPMSKKNTQSPSSITRPVSPGLVVEHNQAQSLGKNPSIPSFDSLPDEAEGALFTLKKFKKIKSGNIDQVVIRVNSQSRFLNSIHEKLTNWFAQANVEKEKLTHLQQSVDNRFKNLEKQTQRYLKIVTACAVVSTATLTTGAYFLGKKLK